LTLTLTLTLTDGIFGVMMAWFGDLSSVLKTMYIRKMCFGCVWLCEMIEMIVMIAMV